MTHDKRIIFITSKLSSSGKYLRAKKAKMRKEGIRKKMSQHKAYLDYKKCAEGYEE